jgi:phosphate transport system substrate-binding protein
MPAGWSTDGWSYETSGNQVGMGGYASTEMDALLQIGMTGSSLYSPVVDLHGVDNAYLMFTSTEQHVSLLLGSDWLFVDMKVDDGSWQTIWEGSGYDPKVVLVQLPSSAMGHDVTLRFYYQSMGLLGLLTHGECQVDNFVVFKTNTAGTAQFGPMSRPMKAEEQEAFEKKFGAKPTEIAVALDALSVYVNKDNPIKSLTFEQLDGIFSKGAARDVATWGDLGLKGEWASRPISLYGRNSASGTYAFFKEHALAKHDYKDTVKEQPGSAAVINGVTEDIAGIGYSGIGYLTSGVKDVPLAAKAGDKPALPTYKNVLTKKYPLSRALYIYVAKVPGKPLDPAVKEFLKFVLSKQGQAVVIKEQYLPLTAKMVEAQLKKLE